MTGRVEAYAGTPTAWREVLGAAKTGQFHDALPHRSVAWRLLLGCLPADESVEEGWLKPRSGAGW